MKHKYISCILTPHQQVIETGLIFAQVRFIPHLAFWDDVLILLDYIYVLKLLGTEMEHEMKDICGRWEFSLLYSHPFGMIP